MKKLRKLTAVLIALVLTLSISVSALAAMDSSFLSSFSNRSSAESASGATGETRWLQDYSNEEVLTYFMSVAYQSEYGGARDHNVRWVKPIRYSVNGNPQEGDLETLKAITERLNVTLGFSGIAEAKNPEDANMKIYFVSMDDFTKYVSTAAGYFWGYANIWWDYDDYGRYGAITNTVVLIADEIPSRTERDSIIYEEVLQSLGLLQDTDDYYESVFYQDNNFQGEAAAIDWALVEILYSPKMITGASGEEGKALAETIIASKSAAKQEIANTIHRIK